MMLLWVLPVLLFRLLMIDTFGADSVRSDVGDVNDSDDGDGDGRVSSDL